MVVPLPVFLARLQPVTADELLPQPGSGAPGHLCAEHGLGRSGKAASLGKAGTVKREELVIAADDPEALEIVAQRQRHDPGHTGIGAKAIQLAERDVSGRHVNMIDARQHQLQRRALGTDDQIDPARVALEPLAGLLGKLQQQHQRRYRNTEQQRVERHAERPVAHIGKRQADHAAASADKAVICRTEAT